PGETPVIRLFKVVLVRHPLQVCTKSKIKVRGSSTGAADFLYIKFLILNRKVIDMLQRPAIFSFFSGAGLLDLGFENSGIERCVNE
ncbi:TPA: hypothetical protein ACIBS5_005385, partial [Salmonella enterica subsp. diarizonae serovar 60-67:z35:-]